jgi:ribonuclease P protein component
MPQKTFSYNKQEKLKSRKDIDELFKSSRSINSFPLKLLYKKVQAETGSVHVGVTVSKRFFKKATDRNRIKRLLRECYRIEKQVLADFIANSELRVNMFFIYTDKTLPELALLQTKMPLLMQRLVKELSEKDTSNT